jgi:hypothetical protein
LRGLLPADLIQFNHADNMLMSARDQTTASAKFIVVVNDLCRQSAAGFGFKGRRGVGECDCGRRRRCYGSGHPDFTGGASKFSGEG